MAASSIMDSLFQRSLDDLIKGLRQQMIGESKFISKSMEEIRREIKTTDAQTKSTALEKLVYLNSLHGVDMSWASFHVVEVMSSAKFAHKKIGYLAASQSFHESTDVILLITNQLRKDLTSANEFEVSLALKCLSVIGTTDLARDLTPEIFTLLGSSKIFVRKKAIAVILRIFSKYPDAVRVAFKRLAENLESSDQQVVSATVGVFCELISKDTKSYLPLAPEFYRILNESKNNWVLIKVLKIFCKLAPLEPRLAKRIVDPICEHMRRTTAKSLMFECIRTVVTSLTDYESAVRLSVEKIRELLSDEDSNLKYLGLQALLVLASKHLWAVVENKECVIKSLSDADPNIKREALRLVMEMVSENNVVDISRILVNYALKSDPDFCNDILGSILVTCSRNVYEVVIDFDWYVSLLGEMSRNPQCCQGEEIERQIVDISLRVKEVRPELVHVARGLLIDPALLSNPFMHKILSAAAWVSGEYVEFSRNPIELIEALLQPRTNLLPPLIRAVYIQSAFKVLVFCVHSFLFPGEAVRSQSLDDLASGMHRLVSEKEFLESPDLVEHPVSTDLDQDNDFSPSFSHRRTEDLGIENVGDRVNAHGLAFSSTSLGNPFTHEGTINMLNLVKMGLGPLSGSDEVEVQERARNVLGLVELIEKEISDTFVEKEGTGNREQLGASTIIEIMQDAFSEGLGPVAMTAQERVPVPEGLVLNENLAELETICGDVLPSESNLFSMGNHLFVDKNSVSIFNLPKKEESEPSSESTALLEQHRKQHGLYYLPSDKNEIGSSDYPPANDPHAMANLIDGAQDLLKLTEPSLLSKKKPNQSKPRPVVVKLDEGDEMPVSAAKPMLEANDDSLSGTLRDILLCDDEKPIPSLHKPSDKSSGKRRVKDAPLSSERASQLKENLGDAPSGPGSSSSRRHKHRSHGKGRHKSPEKNDGSKEDNNSQKDKRKSHHHGRSKNRRRSEMPSNVVAETPVIKDFLL